MKVMRRSDESSAAQRRERASVVKWMGVRTDLARCRDGEELSRAELVRVDLDCADLGHPSDTCQVGCVGGGIAERGK